MESTEMTPKYYRMICGNGFVNENGEPELLTPIEKVMKREFEVTSEQKHVFSVEDLNDLVVGALEGGINYWCGNAKIKRDANRNIIGVAPEDQEKVEFASDVIGYGGTLILTDAEDPKEKWELDAEKLIKGIKMHCTNRGIALCNLLDNYDADDSDAIVQYALFNELVFG